MNRFTTALLAVLLAVSLHAQNRTRFGGKFNALDYAYGVNQNVAPLTVYQGNTATGAQTITVTMPGITLPDGTTVYPLATNAPILVGVGATQDSITPTSISNCSFQSGYGACSITATFTYTHGTGEFITSGSYGIQEAINAANASGGGTVIVSALWAAAGGTTAKITAAAPFSNVAIEDTRSGDSFFSMQPTTLTSLAVPTTLTGTTVVFTASPVGTWSNSAYYFCVTYVDALGGEGPCSATYNQTPTANYTANITSPAASTGAVGWRFYAGASYNAAYLLPITSANCTLTALESVMPACAIGSNGVFTAPPATTTTLRPNGQTPTVNLNLPMPQGHTTFAYVPTSDVVIPFQTHYGPFPQFGALTAGQIAVIGSVNFPTGYLNSIGRSIRLTGKLSLGTVNTATLPTLTAVVAYAGGTTAGVGTTTCTFEGVAAGATKTYNGEVACTLVTNATGSSTASLMPGGFLLLQDQGIAANGLGPYVDTNTAAVGSLNLTTQPTINLVYTSTTNATSTEQLLDLHVEVLQ